MDKSNIENEKERALVDLTNGQKKPENEFEKKLQQDIDDIAAKGGIVEIPSDI